MAAIGRAPEIVAKKGLLHIRLKTEIEKIPDLVGFCYRVAAEDVVLQDTGEGPVYAGISGITPAALAEVGSHVIKLSPGDCHPTVVGWINRNHAFVGRVADDVVAILINVSLIANEAGIRRDHSRRGLNFARRRRRVIVLLQRLVQGRHSDWRQLG